tara:strand:- start:1078 stop:1434 length:357 start_codon:yes stop_codon:yes gene_type:complete
MEDKKIFIYTNIHKIKYHNEIIKYIINNDIKYTENTNGFFVNISLIDEHINNIYNILQYIIFNNNENNEMDYKKQELIEDNNLLKLDKKKYNYNIELKNFEKDEQNLILLSKKYKFDN